MKFCRNSKALSIDGFFFHTLLFKTYRTMAVLTKGLSTKNRPIYNSGKFGSDGTEYELCCGTSSTLTRPTASGAVSHLLWLKVCILTRWCVYFCRIFFVSSSVLKEFMSTSGTSVL